MSAVAAIGEAASIRGFLLAGVIVHPAETAAAVQSAWSSLDPGIAVVILTPAAVAALTAVPGTNMLGADVLTVVTPS